MRIIKKAPTEWEIACQYCGTQIGYMEEDIERQARDCHQPNIWCPSCKKPLAVPADAARRRVASSE